jgi:hypothetical protein
MTSPMLDEREHMSVPISTRLDSAFAVLAATPAVTTIVAIQAALLLRPRFGELHGRRLRPSLRSGTACPAGGVSVGPCMPSR